MILEILSPCQVQMRLQHEDKHCHAFLFNFFLEERFQKLIKVIAKVTAKVTAGLSGAQGEVWLQVYSRAIRPNLQRFAMIISGRQHF